MSDEDLMTPAAPRGRKKRNLPEGPISPLAEQLAAGRPHVTPEEELKAYQQAGSEAAARTAAADVEKQRLALVRDKQDLGLLGAFFGKAWTPAAQVTGIAVLLVAVTLIVTVGLDPEKFTDLQKALLAFISSGLAFFWGRSGK